MNTTNSTAFDINSLFLPVHHAYNITIGSIFLVTHAVLFIFAVIFRNKQPYRSRLFIPFVFNASMCVYRILELINSSLLASKVHYDSDLFAVLTSAALTYVGVICGAGFIWQCIRFLAFSKLSSLQASLVRLSTGGVKVTMSKRDRTLMALYRVITSQLTFALLLAAVSTLLIAYLLILITVSYGAKLYITSLYYQLPIPVFVVLAACVLLVIILYDAILNRKFLLSPFLYFAKTDPLRFRIEVVFLIIGVVAAIGFQCFGFFVPPTITFTNMLVWNAYWVIAITQWVMFNFTVGGFTCFLVVFSQSIALVKRRRAKEGVEAEKGSSDFDEMMEVLLDTEHGGLETMRQYAKFEFSLENVACFTAIQEFKRNSVGKRTEMAREIEQTFIVPHSVLEVNVSSEVKDSTKKQIAELLEGKPKEVETAFTELEAAVLLNIGDTFRRFKTTTFYSDYKRAIQRKIEDAKKMGLA